MKTIGFLFSAAMLITAMPSLAQSNNNSDEVVKIERHATRDYRQGELIVKFRPTSEVRVRSLNRGVVSGVNGVDKVLSELGVTASEQLMPFTGAEVAARSRNLRSVSGKIIEDSDMSQLYRLSFDADKINVHEAVNKLATLDEVEFAEPNYVVYALSTGEEVTGNDKTDDPLSTEQWGHGQLKLDFLWKQKPITNKRPVIAILDTGIDIEHPDLVDNIWTNTLEADGEEDADDDSNGFADDLHGWDFVNQTGYIGDWNGHGTHCAGIAAAVGNNKIGITGANPDALIMPVTVMQSDGTGDVATIIKGIDYAAANGADVISMSIGGYGYSLAEEQALAKAYSTAVLVAAAGNDSKCIYAHDCPVNGKNAMQNGPMFPAAFNFVLGVEASTKDGGLASFSNFDEDGPVFSLYNENQLYNYELRAPGAQILSTFPGGKYKMLNGTSMACPYVAGGISRLLQVKEYGNWEILFGDLIHARKKSSNQLVDFEAAYKITDADRKPTLGLVTYTLDDAEGGDGDGKPDAGETIAFYPTLRNEWGQAKNIRFSLELAEAEDPTIVEILDSEVDFGKELSSYGKNVSATPIRFKVNPECADGRKICMVLRATCDNITEELVQEITLTAENGVEIGGMLTEDLTLYPNVHYIITKTLAIPNGIKLTILPGSVIKFKSNTGLSMSSGAKLDCVGKPDSMIVFTMADHEVGNLDKISMKCGTMQYVIFENLNIKYIDDSGISVNLKNGVIRNNIYNNISLLQGSNLELCNIYNNSTYGLMHSSIVECNVVNNDLRTSFIDDLSDYGVPIRSSKSCNLLTNKSTYFGITFNSSYYVTSPYIYSLQEPSYFGSSREDIIRAGILDMYHPTNPIGYGYVDISNALKKPSAKAHGIVWKVVVNGYDAQDEFEQLPPLGVGKHKFEVYFNRPMNKEAKPMIAMGVRPPYTSHTIAEDGSWNEEGTIYTAYLTITGKTGADGLNRIYVSGAEDDEFFEIPIENTRFNVQVAAAGSMATGLMAEAGLGKVSLTWETDEEDFEDLLGYNIYRYTMDENGANSDSIIVNSNVIDSEETSFVDYDVVPGTTYYYVIKQLTTSLNSHALSNAVAATPLTAQRGDANGSMNVDVADVVTEIAYMTNQDPQPFIFEAADVNSDLTVNILDVVGTLNIITAPEGAGVAAANNTAVYSIENGVLYVESPVALGGVQVRISAPEGTAFRTLEGLDGFEQASAWMDNNEYLFIAYSMAGRTIPAGKQPLLEIGDAVLSQIVFSDARGRNILPINSDATGIGSVTSMQMNLPYPNPFSTQLTIPYVIGEDGNHNVQIVVSDLAGRTVHKYGTTQTFGEYTHTWTPSGAMADGLYIVSLYVDGDLMQAAKVIYKK